MTRTEIALKITELITSLLVPLLILFFGFKLTSKVEDLKAESAKKYFWDNRLSDTFYATFKVYTGQVADFIAETESLALIPAEKKNDSAGTRLQSEINETALKIYRTGIELKLYSNNLFGETSEVTQSITKVYTLVSNAINLRSGTTEDIYLALTQLNSVTEKVFNEKQNQ